MVEMFNLINITPVLALVGASMINLKPTLKSDKMVNRTSHNFRGLKLGCKGRYELDFYAIRKILTWHHQMLL